MSATLAQEHLRAKADELRARFDLADDRLHLLTLELHTPLMISRYKTNVPVPGLPNLDGMLQYASFYWCAHACAREHPEMATHYLWQVNDALEEHKEGWIDFPVPLHPLTVDPPDTIISQTLYDCSVGLPVDPLSEATCYPAGNELLMQNGSRFRRIVDNIPLRRRVPQPEEVYKSIRLTRQLSCTLVGWRHTKELISLSRL